MLPYLCSATIHGFAVRQIRYTGLCQGTWSRVSVRILRALSRLQGAWSVIGLIFPVRIILSFAFGYGNGQHEVFFDDQMRIFFINSLTPRWCLTIKTIFLDAGYGTRYFLTSATVHDYIFRDTTQYNILWWIRVIYFTRWTPYSGRGYLDVHHNIRMMDRGMKPVSLWQQIRHGGLKLGV